MLATVLRGSDSVVRPMGSGFGGQAQCLAIFGVHRRVATKAECRKGQRKGVARGSQVSIRAKAVAKGIRKVQDTYPA